MPHSHDRRRRREPDDAHLPADAGPQERQEAGDRLRERIYVTFTALAILMALNAHGEHLDSPTVLWTLIISVVGVLLAGLASDLVSHMIVHDTLPSAREFRHMLAVASRALTVLAVPVIVLGLAYIGVMQARTAVIVAISALIASLAVIARIAVSRTGLAGWKQLIVLGGIVLLGVIVVFLEQLAH